MVVLGLLSTLLHYIHSRIDSLAQITFSFLAAFREFLNVLCRRRVDAVAPARYCGSALLSSPCNILSGRHRIYINANFPVRVANLETHVTDYHTGIWGYIF